MAGGGDASGDAGADTSPGPTPAAAPGWRARWRRRLRPPRRLRFTREGRWITFLAVGVGLAAINTGNNLLYLLLGWILSFIIASGVLSEVVLRGLRIERRPPPQVHAGAPFLMEVSVSNDKRRLASFSIETEDLAGGVPLDKKCYFLKIPAGRTQRTSYRHTFLRRGRHLLDGTRLATKFPFALFRKSRDLDQPLEIIVFPVVTPMQPPAPRALTRGDHTAIRAGRRGEFLGLREHRDGDDRRDVHWRSSARSGRLMVREYEDELARTVTVLVDNAVPAATLARLERQRLAAAPGQQDADEQAVERAISAAAGLSAAYLGRGWSVELVARGVQVKAAAGRTQHTRILRALALLDLVGDDQPFTAEVSPRAESVLVVPRALVVRGRPPASSVVEA
jgi:uncharacterized protein (DUF58 family)